MILQFEVECVVVFLANNWVLLYQFDQILRIPVVIPQPLLIFPLGFEICVLVIFQSLITHQAIIPAILIQLNSIIRISFHDLSKLYVILLEYGPQLFFVLTPRLLYLGVRSCNVSSKKVANMHLYRISVQFSLTVLFIIFKFADVDLGCVWVRVRALDNVSLVPFALIK